MAKKIKHEYGTMPCRECGQPVKVMVNDEGGFSYNCLARGCDDNDYAKVGTLKHQSWDKKISKFDDAPGLTAKPEPENEPVDNPAPVAKPKLDMWGNPL